MYDGLDIRVEKDVYEPAEDSYLLARHARSLKGQILEIGCGSGIVALANARANPENRVVGVDISPQAVRCAQENARRNGIPNATFHASDLFSHVEGRWDAILFNAPYLALEQEKGDAPVERAWKGGKRGREVLDRFLEQAPLYLKSGGALLFIQNDVNGLPETRRKLPERRWRVEVPGTEPLFFETVYAVRATKKY